MKEIEEIKVSVIIYVKNTVNYIEQCIRSVMDQTLREIEILVVDGGSTDGTIEIIEKLKAEDARIRIFQAPASVGSQFNLGLKEARGQYIGICEADDYIPSDMYEKQYYIVKENQIDVLRAGYYQVCNIYNKEYKFEVKTCHEKELMEKVIDTGRNNFFLEQGINGFWNGLYRKSFLLDNHIWMSETRGAAFQDISFSFLTQMYAEKVWFMKEAFYCYRIDNPNASANSLDGIELHINEYENLRKRLVTDEKWEQYKNIFFSWELLSFRWFLEELPKDLKRINAEKVYRYLRAQIEENKYNVENVMEIVRDLAKKLYSGEYDFIWSIVSAAEHSEMLLEYITGAFKEDRLIILFGIGHIGKIVNSFLELCKKEVLLMDNSKSLQETGFMGKKVYHPKELVKRFPHERYIIANIKHAQEMKTQLIKMGVQSENVLICNNEGFFLRKIFVKAAQYVCPTMLDFKDEN